VEESSAANARPDPLALAISANARHWLHRPARNFSTTVAGVRGLKHQRVETPLKRLDVRNRPFTDMHPWDVQKIA